MDVTNRKVEIKSEHLSETTQVTPKTVKRPFDVAFLMLPDEKLKQKQKIQKTYESEVCYNNNDEDEEVEIEDIPRDYKIPNGQKYYTQKQQIFDDPNLIKARNLEDLRCKGLSGSSDQKSAFTKVNLVPRLSPNPSISPDLSYQNSLSPSPPIINRNYQNFHPNMLSPTQIFKNQQFNAYQNNFIQENFTHTENPYIKNPNQELMQPHFPKMRPMYRPELSYNYQQLPAQEMMRMSQPDIRNPRRTPNLTPAPIAGRALLAGAERLCQVQHIVSHDVRSGLSHAIASQERDQRRA
ncbi:unnamed protein product [Brassicogethes aeneus]|uniref:Uncharacterized protein n=1 Tax=Brassicogethes aeneus TaxID=1431903 RepID=A0A9P0FIZ8_BRAAE|nr:unnamed protein product [Brassicogethes aeneus]